jgi:predicted nucleotidyltransferase
VSSADDVSPPSVPAFRRAFEALIVTLNERSVRYAIIGGVAVGQYTRVRTTEDIDALVEVPQVALPGLLEALGQRGFAVDLLQNLRELRDDGCTALPFAGILVDLLRPVIPAYAHVLQRAVQTQVLGLPAMVLSPEGLVVMKVLAMRPRDEEDVRSLLESYGQDMDLDFIRRELRAAVAADDPRCVKLEQWLTDATNGDG